MVTTPATPIDPSRDEVYTPPELFECLNITFDLDVCAPPQGVPWIPAKKHYSKIDDGLSQPWYGNIWMNPPYSTPKLWIDKFVDHHNGIALLPFARSKNNHKLWDSDAAVVFPFDQRNNKTTMFTFIKNGKRHSIYMPVVLYAFGQTNINALHNIGKVR